MWRAVLLRDDLKTYGLQTVCVKQCESQVEAMREHVLREVTLKCMIICKLVDRCFVYVTASNAPANKVC